MCMMIQIRGFSPSPEGLSCGQKKSPSGFGQQHEIYIFIIEWILTRIHKAAQLRGLFRIAGCSLPPAIVL
ncbi:hypothetical protein DNX55_12085 [Escherichia coli]|jgi:hypothetical protein|nr:hypothetical protein [Escherichia coli]MCH6951374.1 hypothetical protein [Escherichia coli]GCS60120.1 hypothetical protein HmCms187_00377 [Escherichia coli]GCT23093.1 hypothetical protein HmCmsJML017_01794 [Escherichia coli]GCZ02075.1 hypothetical protein HmCmsJML173_02954 [Escherichia coli]